MLSWIFSVLLLLNLALFLWGYQQERSLEASLPPVPEGDHKILLLSEIQAKATDSGANRSVGDPAGASEPEITENSAEAHEPAPVPLIEPDPLGETATGDEAEEGPKPDVSKTGSTISDSRPSDTESLPTTTAPESEPVSEPESQPEPESEPESEPGQDSSSAQTEIEAPPTNQEPSKRQEAGPEVLSNAPEQGGAETGETDAKPETDVSEKDILREKTDETGPPPTEPQLDRDEEDPVEPNAVPPEQPAETDILPDEDAEPSPIETMPQKAQSETGE